MNKLLIEWIDGKWCNMTLNDEIIAQYIHHAICTNKAIDLVRHNIGEIEVLSNYHGDWQDVTSSYEWTK